MYHIGYHSSHIDHPKRSFVWANPTIHFFDERHGRCGIKPHGGCMTMANFRKRIFSELKFSDFSISRWPHSQTTDDEYKQSMHEYTQWEKKHEKKRSRAGSVQKNKDCQEVDGQLYMKYIDEEDLDMDEVLDDFFAYEYQEVDGM